MRFELRISLNVVLLACQKGAEDAAWHNKSNGRAQERGHLQHHEKEHRQSSS